MVPFVLITSIVDDILNLVRFNAIKEPVYGSDYFSGSGRSNLHEIFVHGTRVRDEEVRTFRGSCMIAGHACNLAGLTTEFLRSSCGPRSKG